MRLQWNSTRKLSYARTDRHTLRVTVNVYQPSSLGLDVCNYLWEVCDRSDEVIASGAADSADAARDAAERAVERALGF